MKNAILLIIALVMFGCRPKPFDMNLSSALPPKRVEKTENIKLGFDAAEKEKLSQAYIKAKSPTFGIIDGYYSLPEAKPFGEATVVRGFAYDSYIESVHIKGQKKPFAITPLSGDDAIAMSNAINALLDLGVKIKEISMSDALDLAKEEEQAFKDSKNLKLTKSLPPSVDLLISINRSKSERGDVLVGRVIAKDGRLLAFKVLYHAGNSALLSSLIVSLFEDSINRI